MEVPRPPENPPEYGVNGTPAPVPTAYLPADRNTGAAWRGFDVQRAVGVLLLLGGLWHAAAPWTFGYADVPAAKLSNLIAGLVLAAVGILFLLLRGTAWLAWLAGAIGVWVLIAPHVLGFADRGMAAYEAVWGGPITIVLALIAGAARWLGRPSRAIPAGQF